MSCRPVIACALGRFGEWPGAELVKSEVMASTAMVTGAPPGKRDGPPSNSFMPSPLLVVRALAATHAAPSVVNQAKTMSLGVKMGLPARKVTTSAPPALVPSPSN